jgi:hypothetical protein|tara:strand:+ start:414 stop:617 length:204 start_codon:yes stop_codon:yes gene_type:complete
MNKLYFVVSIYFFLTSNAYAYLDPGTGSIILSAIVAGLVTIKIYWQMIIEKVKKLFSKNENKNKKID